jgi:hypothetical protein
MFSYYQVWMICVSLRGSISLSGERLGGAHIIRVPTGYSFSSSALTSATGHDRSLHRSALSPQYLATYRQHPTPVTGLGRDSDTLAAPCLTWETLASQHGCVQRVIRDPRGTTPPPFTKSERNGAKTLSRSYSPGSFGLACLLPVVPRGHSRSQCSSELSFAILYPLIGPPTGRHHACG